MVKKICHPIPFPNVENALLKINLDYSRVFQNQPKREGRGAVRFRVPP
jgi:hypothetical protein